MKFYDAFGRVLMRVPLLRDLVAYIALSILIEAIFGDWK